MPLIIFTFAFQTETKEATFSGNIPPAQALQILQDIVIADLVKKQQKAEAAKEKTKDTGKGKGDE